jgi:sigma-54 dependent transcriptional regulator, acetoin dehydrogenase operon transcriptional activator AcoR
MDLAPERQLAHAQVLRVKGGALPPGELPAEAILDSWSRCLRSGLDFASRVPVAVIEAHGLAQRRERAAIVRRLAQAELETLAQQIAGSNFLLAFADPDGIILDVVSDNRFVMSGSGAEIVAGSCWSEALCGTNGMGTALASGRSVAVSGQEHYFSRLGDLTCTAAPVRDAWGEVIGVLDASSYVESRQQHTQALVQMAATQLENGLLAHQMREQRLIAIHPRQEFLGTLSAGLLAFDQEGRFLAANARGRQLLHGLQVRHDSTTFEELFDQPFDGVLGRLHVGTDVQLRDALGSALIARCIGRRAAHADLVRPPLIARPVQRASLPANTVREVRVVAEDPDVVEAFLLVEAAVRMKAPILICGETGSGKEILARHAHHASGRTGAFVAINCGALPAELFEAELFGYVGGAFTGARREGSAGLIASADGGTLLLDEVRELPLHLQAALLRFFDDSVVRPVGATATRRVDVQLLAATNADLEEDVAAQRFRADLMYRLNTVRANLPPLRQRRDFVAVVRSVLDALDPLATIDDAAIARLAAHAWPGNFRELRSVLTRALLVQGGHRLGVADVAALLPAASCQPSSVIQQTTLETIRREYERTGQNVSRTSRNLGVSRTTVYRYLGRPASRST